MRGEGCKDRQLVRQNQGEKRGVRGVSLLLFTMKLPDLTPVANDDHDSNQQSSTYHVHVL